MIPSGAGVVSSRPSAFFSLSLSSYPAADVLVPWLENKSRYRRRILKYQHTTSYPLASMSTCFPESHQQKVPLHRIVNRTYPTRLLQLRFYKRASKQQRTPAQRTGAMSCNLRRRLERLGACSWIVHGQLKAGDSVCYGFTKHSNVIPYVPS